jgi:hypothetical protein
VVKAQRNADDECTRERGCGHAESGRGGEPAPCGGRAWQRGDLLFSPLGEKDDLPAVRALGEVGEARETLVLGKGVFDEGAELIRVEVLTGLENLTHDCFGSDVTV